MKGPIIYWFKVFILKIRTQGMTLVLLQEVSNQNPPLTQLPNPTTKQIMLCDLGMSCDFHVAFAQTRKEICILVHILHSKIKNTQLTNLVMLQEVSNPSPTQVTRTQQSNEFFN